MTVLNLIINSRNLEEPKIPDFKVSTVYYQVENGHDRDGLKMMKITSGKLQKSVKTTTKIHQSQNFKKMNDFLDNLGNDQHQKMLREIANDDQTPKKRDSRQNTELFETEEEYTMIPPQTLNEF